MRQCGDLGHEVLTVVEDHQRRVGTEFPGHQVDHWPLRVFAYGQRSRHGVRDRAGLGERGQFNQPAGVGVLGLPQRCGFHGEPALAHTAHTGQRDEPVVLQQRTYFGQFALPADEAGQRRG